MQSPAFGLCIEDITVREVVFHCYIGGCPEFLSETESHVHQGADTYFPIIVFQAVMWVQTERGVVLKMIVLVQHIVHCKADAYGLFV